MRNQTPMHQYFRLELAKRNSVSGFVPDSFLVYTRPGLKRIFRFNLDSPNMQPRLRMLIPTKYAHAAMEDFVPFVTLALAMGYTE